MHVLFLHDNYWFFFSDVNKIVFAMVAVKQTRRLTYSKHLIPNTHTHTHSHPHTHTQIHSMMLMNSMTVVNRLWRHTIDTTHPATDRQLNAFHSSFLTRLKMKRQTRTYQIRSDDLNAYAESMRVAERPMLYECLIGLSTNNMRFAVCIRWSTLAGGITSPSSLNSSIR